MKKLINKVVIITGSRQGLGYSIAKEFLKQGAKVVINGREEKSVFHAVESLKQEGFKDIIGLKADIRSREECFALVQKTIDHWGKIDILINNATDSAIGKSENISEKDWHNTIDVNLSGSFFCSQAVAELSMLKRNKGTIIIISSILGLSGLQERAAYCSAKHGLIGLTKSLAVEWGKHNIRVNAICPSYIMTPIEKIDVESGRCGYSLADIERRTPLGRYSTTEEQVKACLWLATEDSSFTTGSILSTDGGWMAYGGW